MSGLLEALRRMEGRGDHEPAPSIGASPTTVAEPTSTPIEAGPFARFVDALTAQFPPPSLAAFLTIGVVGSITPLLRDHAEAVVERIGGDVVLLGPGLLDDAASLTKHWDALRRRAAYGFLHADSEYALARPNALRSVAAVVPVIELGQSSTSAVAQLRRLLAIQRIAVLGAVVVEA